MLINSLKSRRDDEEGFTLIELMVVVLIIAILIAIAIPTFLGARERAQNRAAQSDLRNGLTAEKTFYTDDENFTVDTALLDDIEPSLPWDDAFADGGLTEAVADVGVNVDAAVCLSKLSKSGTSYALADVSVGPDAGTYYQHDDGGADLCAGATLADMVAFAPTSDAGW